MRLFERPLKLVMETLFVEVGSHLPAPFVSTSKHEMMKISAGADQRLLHPLTCQGGNIQGGWRMLKQPLWLMTCFCFSCKSRIQKNVCNFKENVRS